MNYKIISNFLEEKVAERLLDDIYSTPGHWWSKAVCLNNESAKYLNLSNVSDKLTFKGIPEPSYATSLRQNALTYKFTRSTKHYPQCTCYECTFQKTIVEVNIKETIEKEFFYYNSYIKECFISIYEQGDFLGTHTDATKGIAFMYHLSKSWRAEYGGLLNISSALNANTYTSICPEFNSLVLMNVDSTTGIDHFVSQVASIAPYPRVTVSGWLTNKEEKGA